MHQTLNLAEHFLLEGRRGEALDLHLDWHIAVKEEKEIWNGNIRGLGYESLSQSNPKTREIRFIIPNLDS
jgi:hypothetical protein